MKALAASLIILSVLLGVAQFNRMATADNIRRADAEARRAREWQLVTAPLCQTYFEWSAKTNDRVRGLEDHCSIFGATP